MSYFATNSDPGYTGAVSLGILLSTLPPGLISDAIAASKSCGAAWQAAQASGSLGTLLSEWAKGSFGQSVASTLCGQLIAATQASTPGGAGVPSHTSPPAHLPPLALQAALNVALLKAGMCPIQVDGTVGPITCAAAHWAVTGGHLNIKVPAACNGIVPDAGPLTSCKGHAGSGTRRRPVTHHHYPPVPEALQRRINGMLSAAGLCPLDVDGLLGPNTCAAAAWASSKDGNIKLPAACLSTVTADFDFLKSCPSVTKTPGITTPTNPPGAPQPPADKTPQAGENKPGAPLSDLVPDKSHSNKTAWVVGGLLAVAGGAAVWWSREHA